MTNNGSSESSDAKKAPGTASGTKTRASRTRTPAPPEGAAETEEQKPATSFATPPAPEKASVFAPPPSDKKTQAPPAVGAPTPVAPRVGAPASAAAPVVGGPTLSAPKAAAAPKPRPSKPVFPTPNVEARPGPGDETVKLRIDDIEVEVRKGANVLDAAKLLGKRISHFCYHPALSLAATCRQCLVEIEKAPKLIPACQAVATDGMVVWTETPRVLEARRVMIELTLVNHPIDCPICDKAGECKLQRRYMENDHQLARAAVPKVRKPKNKDIGKHIILDAERCILCGRCVRFCEEIPGTAELTMTFRGDHEEVDIAPGRRLDNPYSVNVVDLCPVGALTFKDFRFKIRPWELRRTDTTCPGCATGCAVELHTKHERAFRVYPRRDPEVNGYFMCDEGRFTYKELDDDKRVLRAAVDGKETDLDEAVSEAARRLKGKKIAAVFSATATNEANVALAYLSKVLDATPFLLGRPRGEGDEMLRDEDKNPNTRGALDAVGKEVRHGDQLALDLAGGAFEGAIFLDGSGSLSGVANEALGSMASVCLADRHTALADACAIRLPAASWAEILGTYTNRQGLLRLVHPAWRSEGDRRHRAELLQALLVAMDEEDTIVSARALTRKLAETANHSHLMGVLDESFDVRPTLLRFANCRG